MVEGAAEEEDALLLGQLGERRIAGRTRVERNGGGGRGVGRLDWNRASGARGPAGKAPFMLWCVVRSRWGGWGGVAILAVDQK